MLSPPGLASVCVLMLGCTSVEIVSGSRGRSFPGVSRVCVAVAPKDVFSGRADSRSSSSSASGVSMRTTGESVEVGKGLFPFDGLARVAAVVGNGGSTARECLMCLLAGERTAGGLLVVVISKATPLSSGVLPFRFGDLVLFESVL